MSTLQTTGLSEPVSLKNLPALRKAFLVGGLVIIFSFVLAFFVTPVFIFFALLPGFGLMVAGLTGWCPMERLLQKKRQPTGVIREDFVQ